MTNDRTSSQNASMPTEVVPTATLEAAAGAGMTRRDVLALLAAFGVPSAALAQDPVKTMPKNYRIAFENEFAGEGGDALVRLRRKFVETADRAHRLFEGKDDLTAHLFRGRARKIDRHRDRGRISLGEKIHAQVPKRKDSENQ